jgi:Tetratricopeptide repeat
VGRQQGLAFVLGRIGDVLIAQGNLSETLDVYRRAFAIRQRLANAEPDNLNLQRDVSYMQSRLGDVLWRQQAREESLKNYRDCVAIRERVAAADPKNVSKQIDLVQAHWSLADRGDEAERRWSFVVSTLRNLNGEKKLSAAQERWIPTAEARLAKLKSTPAARR